LRHSLHVRLADVSEVKKKTPEVLNNISTEEFQKCFQQWEKRWYKCKGEYFEGDWSCYSIEPNKSFTKNNSGYFWVPLLIVKMKCVIRKWTF